MSLVRYPPADPVRYERVLLEHRRQQASQLLLLRVVVASWGEAAEAIGEPAAPLTRREGPVRGDSPARRTADDARACAVVAALVLARGVEQAVPSRWAEVMVVSRGHGSELWRFGDGRKPGARGGTGYAVGHVHDAFSGIAGWQWAAGAERRVRSDETR